MGDAGALAGWPRVGGVCFLCAAPDCEQHPYPTPHPLPLCHAGRPGGLCGRMDPLRCTLLLRTATTTHSSSPTPHLTAHTYFSPPYGLHLPLLPPPSPQPPLTHLGCSVDVGGLIKQMPHNLQMTLLGRDVERGPSILRNERRHPQHEAGTFGLLCPHISHTMCTAPDPL